jgi:hypothetical protein
VIPFWCLRACTTLLERPNFQLYLFGFATEMLPTERGSNPEAVLICRYFLKKWPDGQSKKKGNQTENWLKSGRKMAERGLDSLRARP